MPLYGKLPEFRFKSTTFVNTVCPFCGALHDAHSNVTDILPIHEGANSLCVRCGNISIFDSTALGHLRKPTEAEQKELDSSPEVQKELDFFRRWKAGERIK